MLRALVDTVEAVGLLQAAGACDARKSELHDALQDRDGRYVRLEWILGILDVAPPDFKVRILTAMAEWQGLTICKAKVRTPEEELRETREILLRVAPLALREIDKELGR